MTGRAADPLCDVYRVIEISEVGQVVHAYPFQRLTRFEAGAHRLEIGTVCPNLFMAIHTHGSRRHTGRCGCLNRRVTVTTVDAVVASVVFVTELDWLLALDVLAGVPA